MFFFLQKENQVNKAPASTSYHFNQNWNLILQRNDKVGDRIAQWIAISLLTQRIFLSPSGPGFES